MKGFPSYCTDLGSRSRSHAIGGRRAFRKVDAAVDVLDHQDRTVPRIEQQLPQLRVTPYVGELEVVHVELDVVRHSSH